MEKGSVVLWPRHEVLQLVMPQLAASSRDGMLGTQTTIDAIRRLVSGQTEDGMVSFDTWFRVAKNVLTWNDLCAQLFWDMLSIAVCFAKEIDKSESSNLEYVEVEYISIFLAMHTTEPKIKSPTPTSSHHGMFVDTMWPGNEMETSMASSPVSPSSHGSANSPRKSNPSVSPRSPKSSSRPTSPVSSFRKHSSANSRLSAQYLHSVRQKLPMILSALSHDDCFVEDVSTVDFHESPRDTTLTALSLPLSLDRRLSVRVQQCSVSRRTVDHLRLIIGGGTSREEEVDCISSLHPYWSVSSTPMSIAGNTMTSTQSCTFTNTYNSDANSLIAFQEISNWLDVHMSVNELIYPRSPSISSTGSAPGSPRGLVVNLFAGNNNGNGTNGHVNGSSNSGRDDVHPSTLADSSDLSAHHPHRSIVPLTALNRLHPTVIANLSHTSQMIVASSSPMRVPGHNGNNHGNGGRGSNGNDNGSAIGGNSPCSSDNAMSESGASDNDVDDYNMAMDNNNSNANGTNYYRGANTTSRSGLCSVTIASLPNCCISDCSHSTLYLLSPYSSATISNCHDVNIVIGAVAGSVVIMDCQRVEITVACRKFVVQNSADCTMNIACTSPSVVTNDCNGIVFGPHNTAYRHLKAHLSRAALLSLTTYSNSMDSKNTWSNLCDLNAVVSSQPSLGSPTGISIDLRSNRENVWVFPMPNDAVATIIAEDRFKFLSIPYRSENQPLESSPIPLPLLYSNANISQKQKLRSIYSQLHDLIMSSQQPSDASLQTTQTSSSPPRRSNINNADNMSSEDMESLLKTAQVVSSPIIKKKFFEWLIRNGKVKELMDLVRIDATEKLNPKSGPKSPRMRRNRVDAFASSSSSSSVHGSTVEDELTQDMNSMARIGRK